GDRCRPAGSCGPATGEASRAAESTTARDAAHSRGSATSGNPSARAHAGPWDAYPWPPGSEAARASYPAGAAHRLLGEFRPRRATRNAISSRLLHGLLRPQHGIVILVGVSFAHAAQVLPVTLAHHYPLLHVAGGGIEVDWRAVLRLVIDPRG